MASLERAIYTITYYWHGIDRRSILSILWLWDMLHHHEDFVWSKDSGLPYNQRINNKINEMVVEGHIRLTNRWSAKFGNLGFEPIQKNSTLKVFKTFEKFTERFRQVVNYFIDHPKRFRTYFNNRYPRGINTRTFYKRMMDLIHEKHV